MIEIRELQKEDAKAVSKLIPQLTRNILNSKELEQRLEAIIIQPNSKSFVAEDSGKIVGYAQLAWYQIPSKGKIAWIEEVVVDEKQRGKGLGRALMERLLNLAEELNCGQIKLTAANFIAQKLYESLGFTYKETEVMIKKIKE